MDYKKSSCGERKGKRRRERERGVGEKEKLKLRMREKEQGMEDMESRLPQASHQTSSDTLPSLYDRRLDLFGSLKSIAVLLGYTVELRPMRL